MKNLFSKNSIRNIIEILKYGALYTSIDSEDAMFLYSVGKTYKGKEEKWDYNIHV